MKDLVKRGEIGLNERKWGEFQIHGRLLKKVVKRFGG